MFNRLKREHMEAILSIRLKEVGDRLAAHKIALGVSGDARKWLCDAGYAPAYGARPLARVVKTQILDPLSHQILSGAVKDEETVQVELKDGKIVVVPNHQVADALPTVSTDEGEN